MKLLVRFLRLPPSDRRLLVRCTFLLAAMRIGLCVLSVRKLDALVTRRVGRRRALPAVRRCSAGRIAWAIRAAARYLPGATCLPQAMAAQFMLTRHGHPARRRIGLAVTGEGRIVGHAWVESDAGILLGGGDLTRYTPL